MSKIILSLSKEEVEEIQNTLKDKLFRYEKETENLTDKEAIENCLNREQELKCLINKIENKANKGEYENILDIIDQDDTQLNKAELEAIFTQLKTVKEYERELQMQLLENSDLDGIVNHTYKAELEAYKKIRNKIYKKIRNKIYKQIIL